MGHGQRYSDLILVEVDAVGYIVGRNHVKLLVIIIKGIQTVHLNAAHFNLCTGLHIEHGSVVGTRTGMSQLIFDLIAIRHTPNGGLATTKVDGVVAHRVTTRITIELQRITFRHTFVGQDSIAHKDGLVSSRQCDNYVDEVVLVGIQVRRIGLRDDT